jgi:hypothetical protein
VLLMAAVGWVLLILVVVGWFDDGGYAGRD